MHVGRALDRARALDFSKGLWNFWGFRFFFFWGWVQGGKGRGVGVW